MPLLPRIGTRNPPVDREGGFRLIVGERLDRDRNLTLMQNYRRLGLTSRLNAPTGGTEQKIPRPRCNDPVDSEEDAPARNDVDGLAIKGNREVKKLMPTEARVERDPETGRILRVIRPGSDSEVFENGSMERKKRRLDDPLNSESGSENERATATDPPQARGRQPATGVIAALEAQAEEEAAQLARKKRPRQQSQREEEWIAGLVEKYGDNIAAMARDRRLNPMQQTEADIARRVRKWRHSMAEATTVEATMA